MHRVRNFTVHTRNLKLYSLYSHTAHNTHMITLYSPYHYCSTLTLHTSCLHVWFSGYHISLIALCPAHRSIHLLLCLIPSPWFLPLSDKLLVHCVMGRSRSATLVLAYLMIEEKMTLVDAIEQVKHHRQIMPNWGFLKQLRELDTFLLEQRSEYSQTRSANSTERTNQ